MFCTANSTSIIVTVSLLSSIGFTAAAATTAVVVAVVSME